MKDKKQSILQTGWGICLLALISNLLWGSAFPAIKTGYRYFQVGATDAAAQLLFAGVRFTLAGFMGIGIASALEKKFVIPEKAAWGTIVKISLVQTIAQYFFFYIGLAHTTGVKGSIVIASNVFISILLSALVFRMEKLNGKKLLGCLIGFAGVVLINLNGGGIEMSFRFLGDGFILLAACSSALSSAFLKLYGKRFSPAMLSGYQFLFGGLVLSIGGFAAGGRLGNVSLKGVLLVLYLAFVSAVAYAIWASLLKYNPVSRVSIYGFFNPVFGVLLSTLILQEGNSFNIYAVAALALVCAGIIIVNGRKGEKQGK